MIFHSELKLEYNTYYSHTMAYYFLKKPFSYLIFININLFSHWIWEEIKVLL